MIQNNVLIHSMVKGTTNVFDALSVNHEAFAYVHDKTLGKINEAYDANVYKLTKSRRKSKHVRISSCCYCLFFVSRAYHLFTFAAFFLYSFSSVFYCVFSEILPFQAFGSSFFFLKSKALPIYPNSILLLQGSAETLLIFGYVQSIVQNPLEMNGAQHACEFRVNAEKGNQYDTLCIHMFLLYGNRME